MRVLPATRLLRHSSAGSLCENSSRIPLYWQINIQRYS
jgi:hypothetical protein